MKSKMKTHITMITALGVLASVAGAQPVNAVGAARANVPVMPPAPAVSVGAAQSSAASASAAARAPVLPPTASTTAATASANAGANAGMNAGARGTPGLNSQATTNASAQGQANGLAVASVATDNTRVTLRMDETVKTIRAAAFAEREKMAAEVQARLDASANLVSELRVKSEAAGDKSRAAFAKALVEVRQSEKQVRADLRAATKAAGESTWGSVQSELAKSYGAYAQAVAGAELAAQGTAEVTTPPKG